MYCGRRATREILMSADMKKPDNIPQEDWDRFWDKTQEDGECILWTACKDKKGYGYFGVPREGKTRAAYRIIYGWVIGPIGEGMELHHVCQNRSCVNPYHLIQLTHNEHAATRRKETCSRGHRLEGDNIFYEKNGVAKCRQCRKERCREWYALHRESQLEHMRQYNQKRKLSIA
jgi:hypothetical protein